MIIDSEHHVQRNMLKFFKQKQKTPDTDVIETLTTRIERLEASNRELRTYVIDAQTDIDALRSKVLRKIQNRDAPAEEAKEINTSMRIGQPVRYGNRS